MNALTLAATGFALVIGLGTLAAAAYDALEHGAPYWLVKNRKGRPE